MSFYTDLFQIKEHTVLYFKIKKRGGFLKEYLSNEHNIWDLF